MCRIKFIKLEYFRENNKFANVLFFSEFRFDFMPSVSHIRFECTFLFTINGWGTEGNILRKFHVILQVILTDVCIAITGTL